MPLLMRGCGGVFLSFLSPVGFAIWESVVQLFRDTVIVSDIRGMAAMCSNEITTRLVVDRQYRWTTVVRVQIVPFLLVQKMAEME